MISCERSLLAGRLMAFNDATIRHYTKWKINWWCEARDRTSSVIHRYGIPSLNNEDKFLYCRLTAMNFLFSNGILFTFAAGRYASAVCYGNVCSSILSVTNRCSSKTTELIITQRKPGSSFLIWKVSVKFHWSHFIRDAKYTRKNLRLSTNTLLYRENGTKQAYSFFYERWTESCVHSVKW